jgi:hypothetical protein
MAPYIVGATPSGGVSAYQIDDSAQTFSKSTYLVKGTQEGELTYFAGATTALARGLLSLGLTYSDSGGNSTITTYTTSQTLCTPTNSTAKCSWAVELPNQAGGLIAINGQPVQPLAPATSCPGSTTQTYQFLTLPAPLLTSGTQGNEWNPTLETGFGSVDVSGSGSTITFNNIQQYTLPATAGDSPGAPATTVTSPQTGACSSTYYGNTTVVPASMTITDPGNGSPAPAVAAVAIGPTGLLVESNAANGLSNTAPYYQNLLGAGTGAIGLPKPSSALDTSALIGAQYLGFFYESGTQSTKGGCGNTSNGPSTCVASFGFDTLPTNCKSVATQTSTMIYGGDFTKNNPSVASTQTAGGFGKCDMAIDLGTEDSKNNGLYPNAKVYVGTAYAGNGLGAKYNFPVVAIAGQLNGKYVIFLLGADTKGSPNQAWGIYLLQSN